VANRGGKIALFFDGPHVYATGRALGFEIDYKRLLAEFQRRGALVRAFYYSTVVEDEEFLAIRPLLDWLDYNGFTIVTKPTKEWIDGDGRRNVKNNMAVELVIDAMQLAEHVDQMVLFSGDGNFRPLIGALQRRGVRVTVVSSILSDPPMIGGDLRRQADAFVDLQELKAKVGRSARSSV
jgi:uncharacterized LabA/DUF88 family protein